MPSRIHSELMVSEHSIFIYIIKKISPTTIHAQQLFRNVSLRGRVKTRKENNDLKPNVHDATFVFVYRSAFTNQWLFLPSLCVSPVCDHCGKEESIDHILFYCARYSKAPAGCWIGNCDPTKPTAMLFRKGTRRKRQYIQSISLDPYSDWPDSWTANLWIWHSFAI